MATELHGELPVRAVGELRVDEHLAAWHHDVGLPRPLGVAHGDLGFVLERWREGGPQRHQRSVLHRAEAVAGLEQQRSSLVGGPALRIVPVGEVVADGEQMRIVQPVVEAGEKGIGDRRTRVRTEGLFGAHAVVALQNVHEARQRVACDARLDFLLLVAQVEDEERLLLVLTVKGEEVVQLVPDDRATDGAAPLGDLLLPQRSAASEKVLARREVLVAVIRKDVRLDRVRTALRDGADGAATLTALRHVIRVGHDLELANRGQRQRERPASHLSATELVARRHAVDAHIG